MKKSYKLSQEATNRYVYNKVYWRVLGDDWNCCPPHRGCNRRRNAIKSWKNYRKKQYK